MDKLGSFMHLFVMFYCVFATFPCGILGQIWYLIVSIPDFCRLSYFLLEKSCTDAANLEIKNENKCVYPDERRLRDI